MSLIRLKGSHDSYVIAEDLWDELLTWAEETGWKPQQVPERYRTDRGVTVTAKDADHLADALEMIAGSLVLSHADVPEEFVRELIDRLMELTNFFHSGGFEIC